MIEKSKQRALDEANVRSTQIGERVSSIGQDFRDLGQTLRTQGQRGLALLVDQGADKLELLGRYLTDSDSEHILADLDAFRKEQPWAVTTGGFVLGFAAARLIKASTAKQSTAVEGQA